MDVSSVHWGKRPKSDHVLPPGLDMRQIFFTNLQILGFNAAAMEMKYKIPFNKEMFNLPNKAGAETVLYFLFNRLNPTMCRQEFRDCWPVTDKKAEATFRKICCIWLQNIQKEEPDARLPRINAALFLSPVGDRFYHLLFAFSTFIILQTMRKEYGLKDGAPVGYPILTSQNKDLGFVMETTVNCAAVRHRRRYLEVLGQTASAKQGWQKYSDELTKSLRSLTKGRKELERDVRDEMQTAAQKGLARGSPIPASRRPQDFEMSEHLARRAQRLQHVRSLWKEVEGYVDGSKEEQAIINSIIDRTQEKYSIDAASMQISIPHLMLRECEQEMRRRQVENIYEGGELNLLSVLQLWNMALHMYIQRLQQGGLKDLSDEAINMRSQAHSHQAYLANTSVLREKMTEEIPQRKKAVTKLRNQFRSEVNASGLGMTAPSPPVTFDPPRGHSGVTPTGPVAQMSRDQVETPEAAADIAKFISETSRKTLAEADRTQHIRFSDTANKNRNNSARLPQPTQRSRAGDSKESRERPKSSVGGRGRGGIQPRVVRHISRQSAAPPSSSHKKSAPGKEKGQVSSSRPLVSTPEKTPRRQPVDPDKTPVPSDYNNSAAETARHRAHNMLAEKIVWAVMHGEDEEGDVGLPHELGLISPRRALTSGPTSSNSPRGGATLPSPGSTQKQASSSHNMSLFSDRGSPPTSFQSQSLVDGRHKVKTASHKHGSTPRWYRESSDSEHKGKPFIRATSPVTLVQQARLGEAEDFRGAVSGDDGGGGGRSERKRTEGDGGEPEAEDVNIENPGAALSEDVFVTHDVIYRSPLAGFISQMWREAISDDAEDKDSASNKDLAADWLDSDRSSVSSVHDPTPRAQQSSSSSDPTPQPSLTAVTQEQLEVERQSPAFGGEVTGETGEKSPGWWEGRPDMAQTMINSTQAFVTSFDEDGEELDALKAKDKTVGWEERHSALYDDPGELEGSGCDRRSEHSSDDVVAFNLAVDNLFKNKDHVGGESSKVLPITDSGDHVILPGHHASPLISFTPQKTLPQVSRDTASQGMARKEESVHDYSHVPPSDIEKSSVKLSQGTAKFSPEGSSDKENYAAGRQRDVPQSLVGSTLLGDSLGRSVQKNGSSGGVGDSAVTDQDEIFDEDDLMNTSGASPFNDSFTPLYSGLLVQGRSPARSTLKSGSGSLFSDSVTSHVGPTISLNNLDENLAAQLNRLRKLKSEAFSGLKVGELEKEQGREKGTSNGTDASLSLSSLLSASRSTQAVGKEKQAVTVLESETGPLDIFGEDDSILLPPSP